MMTLTIGFFLWATNTTILIREPLKKVISINLTKCSHWVCADFWCLEMIFAYSCPYRYMVRLSLASAKSTWNNPKRTLNPSAHSKLSISDHAKYPRTFTPSSCIAEHNKNTEGWCKIYKSVPQTESFSVYYG